MSRKTRRNTLRKATKVSFPVTNGSTHKFGLSAFLLGSIAISGTPFAAQPADTPPAPAPAAADAELQEVVVTGIRASQEASIQTKRNADTVVDAITAEDVGKFPDKNVAESLSRVPGVVINREFGEGEQRRRRRERPLRLDLRAQPGRRPAPARRPGRTAGPS